jgi:hypothetical protein
MRNKLCIASNHDVYNRIMFFNLCEGRSGCYIRFEIHTVGYLSATFPQIVGTLPPHGRAGVGGTFGI